ncbi:MotA/TolQ/ExbB proton channel family protein [Leptospira sp. GIMC2001]|uniref:MotA/TolQ/ExbB proton channel family protein n=1 Tax=Leptospira sp. GIMC2001 TaxID=1513297 RepID=UPI002349F3FA|nr:MotA/TolQ/ExbB proton channel family protein [Leptospira sp. GIMC2001]WCL47891.1 MotA/TolQ/ExbB proton channel family protein [Leptospira sp. GIMC2001]
MFFLGKSDSLISSVPPETIPVVIIMVSIIMLTIVIERMVYYWKLKPIDNDSYIQTKELLRSKKWDEAKDLLASKSSNPASLVLQVGIDRKRRNLDYIEEEMQSEGYKQIRLMEKFLSALGTIATVSPLLGVLGTVIGIIRSFAEGAGTKGAEVGISEALITTAMGLAVAIPAYVFYNYLVRVKEDRIIEMENLSNQILPYLEDKKK